MNEGLLFPRLKKKTNERGRGIRVNNVKDIMRSTPGQKMLCICPICSKTTFVLSIQF